MTLERIYEDNCNACGALYEVRQLRYPQKDDKHDLNCDNCSNKLRTVPKGTTDYLYTRIESITNAP